MANEEKTYSVPFAFEKRGRIEVVAGSEEEAIALAKEKLAGMAPAEMEAIAEYLPDSEEIDVDGNIFIVEGK